MIAIIPAKYQDKLSSMLGLHIRIVNPDHPWFMSTGIIKSIDADFQGQLFFNILLDDQDGTQCAIYYGKEMKNIPK